MTASNAVEGFNDKVAFIWSVADLLRGDVRPHEYGQFVLPFVVLRRLDSVLEPTKKKVIDKAASLVGKVGNVDPILERVTGAPFYNTSPLTFKTLLNDPANIKANLNAYVAGFSAGAAEVLEKYRFPERIATLDKAGLLYQIVAKFADIDLHPKTVPNHAMGYIFEELLRRFSEMQNETAGEHFTPREVIKLMVNILFSEDEKALSGTAPVRTMLDPAAGTGGMLSTAQDHLAGLNPDAHLEVYGQELNPETWAICRSDMLIKGENPENIVLGNSFTADGHRGTRFDYLLANPPFGVDWKKYAEAIQAEAENEGEGGRFGAGLPRVSDGSLLFLQHMLSKMKPVIVHPDGATEGGTRLAIVFSGSPLFSGAAESGESNIRRWILENDWLEAIVALPDQLFYNTGIHTYFWVLTNRKNPERKGKVALVDARGFVTKMKKSLGNKRNYISDEDIAEITQLYAEAPQLNGHDPRVRVVDNSAFGYHRVAIEQPMRKRWVISESVLTGLAETKVWLKNCEGQPSLLYAKLKGTQYKTEKACLDALKAAGVPTVVIKELVKLAAVSDPTADIVRDRNGNPLPDPELRDYENIPLAEDTDEYLASEISPYTPEAWIDPGKTKVGYEIPFTRYFYVYKTPRPVADIDGEISEREDRIRGLLESFVS